MKNQENSECECESFMHIFFLSAAAGKDDRRMTSIQWDESVVLMLTEWPFHFLLTVASQVLFCDWFPPKYQN